ncbi:MAG: VIT1/CCC1 transporter family protein [Thermoplasmata archaeon]|nr:VIT1/CCC1 transporter family protein [Thermoplasmata archaeon]
MPENSKETFKNRFKRYAEISNVGEISRRYFVMNAFDGALTMLGVVIGTYLANIKSPLSIISAGVAGSLAMGVSGISGAYMTEKAERLKQLKTLEKAMLKDLKNSVQYRSYRFAVVIAALIDGLSPALASVCVISPFFLVHLGFLAFDTAFLISMAITLIVLFSLGVYLAKISEENMVLYGLQMLMVGIITAVLAIVVSLALGGGFV